MLMLHYEKRNNCVGDDARSWILYLVFISYVNFKTKTILYKEDFGL
jgi:hypothetical protein